MIYDIQTKDGAISYRVEGYPVGVAGSERDKPKTGTRMKHNYELTSEEFRHIMNALEYAEQNAVHEDSKSAFVTTRHELLRQEDEQETQE
jgi:hypothetical protein